MVQREISQLTVAIINRHLAESGGQLACIRPNGYVARGDVWATPTNVQEQGQDYYKDLFRYIDGRDDIYPSVMGYGDIATLGLLTWLGANEYEYLSSNIGSVMKGYKFIREFHTTTWRLISQIIGDISIVRHKILTLQS